MELLRTAKGRIINITSVGGKIAGPMLGAYHASKFAMEAISDTLRQELAPWGIEVVSIEPGAVATPIWEAGARNADRIMARMPARTLELYGGAVARTRAGAEHAARTGIPTGKSRRGGGAGPDSAKAPNAVPVGVDGKIGARIMTKLPDRLRDRMLRRAPCNGSTPGGPGGYSTLSTSFTSFMIPALGRAPTASRGFSFIGMNRRLGMLWMPNAEAMSTSSSTLTL